MNRIILDKIRFLIAVSFILCQLIGTPLRVIGCILGGLGALIMWQPDTAKHILSWWNKYLWSDQ